MEGGGDNWDLHAVVRGCGGAAEAGVGMQGNGFSSAYLSAFCLSDEERGAVASLGTDDLAFYFPDLQATRTALQELDELCKPFLPHLSPPPLPPQPTLQLPPKQEPTSQWSGPPCTTSQPSLPAGGMLTSGKVFSQQLQLVGPSQAFPSPSNLSQLPRQSQLQPRHQQRALASPSTTTPRSKRRKNQQKRVVCQVPADGLSSDVWAWRKYGQKPIKGSPYPRGYYRCSSSKGCLARKQVERSRADPSIYVITYTAEHNHPVPTHRNSLAGSTRNKFPPALSTSDSGTQQVNGGADLTTTSKAAAAAASSPLSSPVSAGQSSSPSADGKKEFDDEDAEAEGMEGEEEDGLLMINDMEMLGEDDVIFPELDDLHGLSSPSATSLLSEQFSATFSSSSWMTSNPTAAAGGDG